MPSTEILVALCAAGAGSWGVVVALVTGHFARAKSKVDAELELRKLEQIEDDREYKEKQDLKEEVERLRKLLNECEDKHRKALQDTDALYQAGREKLEAKIEILRTEIDRLRNPQKGN